MRDVIALAVSRIVYLGIVLFCTYKLGGWYWVGIAAGIWGLIPRQMFKGE